MEKVEGDLRFDFTGAQRHKKFDEDYKLSHCMKAVDFIVEMDDRILFIEVKDPDNPNTKPEERKKYLKKLKIGSGGKFISEELVPKCRDTFIYQYSTGLIGNSKPIFYCVLIALDTLDYAELNTLKDELKRLTPASESVPDEAGWTNPFIKDCIVFNVSSWNEHFKQQMPVVRISGEENSIMEK